MIRTPTALLASALALLASGAQAAGRPSQINDKLMLQFEIGTRIEQRCDARARGEVSRARPNLSPDTVIAYAFSEPVVTQKTEIDAPGAIFRSKGKWYKLSFHCKTTPDGLGIISFRHAIGPEVPGWTTNQLYKGQ